MQFNDIEFNTNQKKIKKKSSLKGKQQSKKQNWETPKYLFNYLNLLFDFTLDPAADHQNHLCAKYYTKEDSGLVHSWKNESVFVNPPYNDKEAWLKKCDDESKHTLIIVALVPNSVESRGFWKYCIHHEVWFLKGRVTFLDRGVPSPGNPLGSVIVIFRSNHLYKYRFVDLKKHAKEYEQTQQNQSIDQFIT